jgi:hypothetical protein
MFRHSIPVPADHKTVVEAIINQQLAQWRDGHEPFSSRFSLLRV